MARCSTIERTWTVHDLPCAVLLMDMGHRCGYVSVPEGHPYHGLGYSDQAPNGPADYEDRPIDDAGMGGMIAMLGGAEGLDTWANRIEAHIAVHGGLTYTGTHPGDLPKGWWFGFDCAHADDDASYWTEDRVASEVERMAEQLAAVASVEAT